MRKLDIRGGKVLDSAHQAKGFHLFCDEEVGVLLCDTFANTVYISGGNCLHGKSVTTAKNLSGKGTARAVIVSNCAADVLQVGARERSISRVNYTSDRLMVPASEVRPLFVGELTKQPSDEETLARIKACVGAVLAGEFSGFEKMETPSHTCAVSFYLGDDYVCTISGTVFADNGFALSRRTVLLTTDVLISQELMYSALETELRDSFFLFSIPFSPNDGFAVLSSGLAGNNKITRRDVEYAKFVKALRFVLHELCGDALTCGNEGDKIRFKAVGATSKRVARDVVQNAHSYFHAIGNESASIVKGLLSCVGSVETPVRKNRLQIWLESDVGRVLLIDMGRLLYVQRPRLQEILEGNDATITVDFRDGSYAASGWIRKMSRSVLD